MAIHIPIPTAVVDLADRVAATFIEATLAGLTTSAVTNLNAQPWSAILSTAGYAALYALGKGVLGLLSPASAPGSGALVSVPPAGNPPPPRV